MVAEDDDDTDDDDDDNDDDGRKRPRRPFSPLTANRSKPFFGKVSHYPVFGRLGSQCHTFLTLHMSLN